MTVLEMSAVYQDVKQHFTAWAQNAADLLDSSGRPFPDAKVSHDAMSDELFSPQENDGSVLALLHLLCAAFSVLAERQLADHLETGKYSQPTESLSAETKSVPKTNRASEKDFAQLDRLVGPSGRC